MSSNDLSKKMSSSAGFQQLLDIALTGDRDRFVDAIESVGLPTLMERDEFGNTLLHLTAAVGDLKMTKLLLRFGIPEAAANDCNQTAAMVAESCGNSDISEYLNRKMKESNSNHVDGNARPDVPQVNDNKAGDGEADTFEQDYLDAVLNYAILIGIDATQEPHLLHIAEEGLGAPLPAEWQERDGKFFHVDSGLVQTDHPNDDIFRRRVAEARDQHAQQAARDSPAETAIDNGGVLGQEEAADVLSNVEKEDSGSEYNEDFEEVVEQNDSPANLNDSPAKSNDSSAKLNDSPAKLLSPALDEEAVRVMMLLQERLKLKTRDMERYGRQTHRAASPDFMPKTSFTPGPSAAYSNLRAAAASTANHGKTSRLSAAEFTLPQLNVDNSKVSSKSEFDRLMKRYMGFSPTQASLSFDDRRQKRDAVKDALKGIRAEHNNITTSLRQFLDTKTLDRSRAASRNNNNTDGAKAAQEATLPAMSGSHKGRAPPLSASPFQGSARPPNNPWIHPRKFTMLFNPEHMRPSKASSQYSKIKPVFMEGRCLQSPSVSVALYPSINPNRMSDDHDPFAYVLDPRRRHKLIAKQLDRSDRSLCASPWSPELKKSGVWDRNGYLDCNAFLFGDKYVHYTRQSIAQMSDLDDELRRKGVQNAEELLWPNPDPYRHIRKRGVGARSP
jgi:ankyrin repeat protein